MKATSLRDAHRLAQQGSFGATERLLSEIQTKGARRWVADQMALGSTPTRSRYTSGGSSAIHQVTDRSDFCMGSSDPNCWVNHFSTQPLLLDFYHNAVTQPDQLRQRVALAMQQWLVVSGRGVLGTYGFRQYHNMLLEHAFGNYRDVLRQVALSPLMGDFLNNANNSKSAPNENFARELMQLFSIGLCELNIDGSLKGGKCQATYDNHVVREMAFALTGWTYPPGALTKWGCGAGLNCRYYLGNMVSAPSLHDTQERTLLNGFTLPAGSTAEVALDRVLDSLITHPNTAPFIAQHFIRNLVTSNPSGAYISRVAQAFAAGQYGGIFGKGRPGDIAATVAATLLDVEARGDAVTRKNGQLREPVLLFTGVVRALNMKLLDPGMFSYWLGDRLQQQIFESPTVFNFYPPDYAMTDSSSELIGPAFGIHNAATAIERMGFLNCAIDWGGCGNLQPDDAFWLNPYIADGTPPYKISNLDGSIADVNLVDRLSYVAYGMRLPDEERQLVLDALKMRWATPMSRVKQAMFLIFSSPRYQVIF